MAFPSSPTNNQQATVNGITYVYNSTKTAWLRASTTGANLTANSLSITSSTTSSSTTSGALLVTGGAGIQGSLFVGSQINATASTASTNTTTGALVIAGGVGIGGNLFVGSQINATASTASTNTTTGALVIAGGAGIQGSLYVGGSGNYGGNVIPITANIYDLGSTSFRWRNIYTNDLQLSNGIGDYTVVEGEEDLFLYNNKTGKTFKFMLQEVDPSQVPPKMG